MVSIISPSFNSSKYVSDTIESVIAQTYKHWELIIVDDASNDNSVSIIEKYSKEDSRIKLVKLTINGGAAKARNAGLRIAKGRYIAFIDSDDVWLPKKLTEQLIFMQKHKAPISFTSYGVYNEILDTEFYSISVPNTIDYKGYLKNTIIGMSTTIIDKNIVGDFSFYNIRTRQDTYLWITLLKKGFIAYGINNKLAKYRIRPDSISANKIKAVKQVWFLYHKLEKFNILKTLYYISFYGYNAIKKRK